MSVYVGVGSSDPAKYEPPNHRYLIHRQRWWLFNLEWLGFDVAVGAYAGYPSSKGPHVGEIDAVVVRIAAIADAPNIKGIFTAVFGVHSTA